MSTKVVPERGISVTLIGRWEQFGQKLTALAEGVPENKFDYRPVDGVRTFADVLRHVAFWNQYVADSALGREGNDAANELPGDEFSTKAQIVQALTRSAADATEALRGHSSGLSPEIAEMLVTFLEHHCEHYGQLVVYARLNGIIPPASRG
jgi:DinB superfamily